MSEDLEIVEVIEERVEVKRRPRQTQKPPLKLCFKDKIDPGRSKIVPFRPKTYEHYVTRKFYVPDYTEVSDEKYQQVKREYENSPKAKYGYPILESHSYGWFADISFQDPDFRNDRRLYFPRVRDPLFVPCLTLAL